MAYTTKTELIAMFGESIVGKLANQTDNASTIGAAEDARITSAIAWAGSQIDNRLRGTRYTVPLVGLTSSAPVVINDLAKKLAMWWLYNTRLKKKTEAIYKNISGYKAEADTMLAAIAGNLVTLDAQLDTRNVNTPFVVG
jgi:phage gp36-like protein